MHKFSRLVTTLAVAAALSVGASFASADNIPGTSLQPSVWFDASQITSSSDPVLSGLSNGQTLPYWPDESGNARNATQPAGNRRPSYRTNVVNGLPAVRFNLNGDIGSPDVNQFVAFPGALANTAASDLTLFVVANDSGTRSANPSSRAVTVNTRTNSSQANGFFLGKGATPLTETYAHVGNAITSGGSQQLLPFNEDDFNLSTVRRDGLSSDLATFDDIGSANSSVTWTGFTPSALATTQIGTEGGIHYFFGDIAEIIAFEGTLSATDYSSVVKYLGDKYAINAASAIPEPTSLGLLAIAALTGVRRRRN